MQSPRLEVFRFFPVGEPVPPEFRSFECNPYWNPSSSGDRDMINGFNLRNPIRGQKGFTLVEVIVVAIIVAALAAVAIPLYNNYVATSRNNAAANAAGSVASFMGACMNQQGAVTPASITTATPGPLTLTCTYGTPAATTTIAVPAGITITVSSLTSSPGTVTATSGGGANQVYNY
jgi:prepilin-type N-terminal cleavage/methylation domain-containing protein